MDDTLRRKEALFRFSVLGPVLSRSLRRGELKALLCELAAQEWTDEHGRERSMSFKTLEEWYYRYRKHGFDGLLPRVRKDRGRSKIPPSIRTLILDMKREDPGRSAVLIKHELVQACLLEPDALSVSTIQRLLRREGLSVPSVFDRRTRLRWQASFAGELWQTDACHGPKLLDPKTGRATRVKIFALLDDRSRLVPYLQAGFHETQTAFLTVLLGAVQRRGTPRCILADNHKSFTGTDTRIACAQLGIRLTYARPYDGPAKGKVERFWRTLRARVLDRLDPEQTQTLNDLNLRLSTWIEAEYNRGPHSAHGGRTPLSVWEEDLEQIRWIEDLSALRNAFTRIFERKVSRDCTCQIQGRLYEAPLHLSGQTVQIGTSLLAEGCYWVLDGSTQLPLRELDAEGNAQRPRPTQIGTPPSTPARKTGLNPVEDLLRRITRPLDGSPHEGEGDHAA